MFQRVMAVEYGNGLFILIETILFELTDRVAFNVSSTINDHLNVEKVEKATT